MTDRAGSTEERSVGDGRDPHAVVVGLDSLTGLQTARILARRGVPVVGVAGDPKHPCCRTNVCERIVPADPAGRGLIDALSALGERAPAGAVLFPCTDLGVLTISRHRQALAAWYHIALPDAPVVEMLVDKVRFHEFAREQGLPVPSARVVRTARDLDTAAHELRFPCMVKPAVKDAAWRRISEEKAYRVGTPAALRRLYDRLAAWPGELLVQEWIEGDDAEHFTCNCYFDAASVPRAVFVSRKLRQWPPTGGEGCLSVATRNDAVRRETLRLFERVDHRGLGYLEMKRDVRTGEYVIIEPNVGRPTGRSANAELAGVELLYTQYCDAIGRPLPARRDGGRDGVKWIHVRRDTQSAIYHWSRGELTVRDWLTSLRGIRGDALFSWRDPIPFCADLARVALGRRPRLFRRRRARSSARVGGAAGTTRERATHA